MINLDRCCFANLFYCLPPLAEAVDKRALLFFFFFKSSLHFCCILSLRAETKTNRHFLQWPWNHVFHFHSNNIGRQYDLKTSFPCFMSNHRLTVRHGLLAPKIFCFNPFGKSFAFHWCFSGVLWVPSQVWSFVVLWLGFNPYGLHSSGDLSNLPVFHLYSHWSSKARRKQGLLTSHTFESTIFW